jgi:hypothetical protein
VLFSEAGHAALWRGAGTEEREAREEMLRALFFDTYGAAAVACCSCELVTGGRGEEKWGIGVEKERERG